MSELLEFETDHEVVVNIQSSALDVSHDMYTSSTPSLDLITALEYVRLPSPSSHTATSAPLYCFGVIGPSGYGGDPCSPRSSSPLSPGPPTGFISETGSCASPLPSGLGGVFVPGPPRRSQSRKEPRYSPTFS